jgi:hypothetical protein
MGREGRVIGRHRCPRDAVDTLASDAASLIHVRNVWHAAEIMSDARKSPRPPGNSPCGRLAEVIEKPATRSARLRRRWHPHCDLLRVALLRMTEHCGDVNRSQRTILFRSARPRYDVLIHPQTGRQTPQRCRKQSMRGAEGARARQRVLHVVALNELRGRHCSGRW